MSRLLTLLGPLLLAYLHLPALQAMEQPVLLGQSTARGLELALDARDLRWLHNKHELVMGVTSPNFDPLEMTNANRDFEGVTADYLGVIAQSLGLNVRLQSYPSREEALQALAMGEVDLLGSATPYEAERHGLALSRYYVTDSPVLVARLGLELDKDTRLAGLRLAIPHEYRPLDELKAQYPHATLLPFATDNQAMAAVSFGKADVMLTNALSAQFLISKVHSDYVRIAKVYQPKGSGYAFALREDEGTLERLVNTVLEKVSDAQAANILRRWGERMMLSLEPLPLTSTELQWIQRNPVVKVAINRYYAPISYIDGQGNHLGITSDLLALLAAKTGLQFEMETFDGFQDIYDAAKAQRIQLVANLSPDAYRESLFHFTRPYLYSPYLLVTRTGPGAPESLDQLDGKTLTLTQGESMIATLQQQHPGVHIHEVKTALESLAMITQGESDATILPELVASHNLLRHHQDNLQITAALDTPQFTQALAVRRDEYELFGILEKAIRSIPPDALTELSNHWRTKAPTAMPNWRDYKESLYLITGGSALLVLIAIAWGLSMRRQVKQRLLAERALGDQMHFMEALINGTPHPIYVRDVERRMVLCNDSYLEVFRREREAVIGTTISELSVDEKDDFERDFERVLSGGQPLLKDRVVHIDGLPMTIYHWKLPYQNAEGEVVGVIGGWIDISERQLLVDQLLQAKDTADDASRAKSTFLATMSHEIRTPMSAVIGMLELALRHADAGRLDRESIEVAYGSAQGMLALIGDILDIARIESGHLSLAPERANLRQLLESVVRVFDGLARQKGLRLILDMDNGANVDLLLDPQRLRQIVSNLVSNAIKFTDQGSVSLIVRTLPGEDEQLQVQIDVIDTGIGISAHDQQKLFQPFAQVPGNSLNTRTGTGLGLMISRTLCEMMGGRLQLESEPGVGTRILLQLSFAQLEALSIETPLRTLGPVVEPAAAPLTVLVVDDSYANRKLLCDQLAFLGHTVHQAENGEQGLALWPRHAFDLVITDCNMPVLSGYELARRIREQEHDTPIWGFTANAQPDERQRCLDAGMDDCLFKPIALPELGARLRKLTPRAAPVTPAETETETETETVEEARFDVRELEHFTGGDPALTRRALEGILQSHRLDLQQVRSLLDSGSEHGIVELAHRIKGAARIIRARTLIDGCEQLEAAFRASASPTHMLELLQELEADMLELDAELLALLE